MMSSLLIDLVILAALAAALVWGVILARRIARLQTALAELAPALQAFCDAVEQSERSVQEIRRETDRMSEVGQRVVPEAAKPQVAGAERQDLVRRFFAAARMRQEG